MAKSLCYLPETIITLLSSYTSIENKTFKKKLITYKWEKTIHRPHNPTNNYQCMIDFVHVGIIIRKFLTTCCFKTSVGISKISAFKKYIHSALIAKTIIMSSKCYQWSNFLSVLETPFYPGLIQMKVTLCYIFAIRCFTVGLLSCTTPHIPHMAFLNVVYSSAPVFHWTKTDCFKGI